MTWEGRLREAAYTPPSGARLTFTYVDLSTAFDRNTAAFTFPGVDGTYVQDLGTSARRFPFRVIFWGDNHDTEAQTFADALAEPGRGKLDHPRKGTVTVVPFGTITEREDLVTAANQTVFDVVFWEANLDLFPSGSADPASTVRALSDATNTAAAETLAGAIGGGSAVDVATFRARYETALGATRSALGDVAALESDTLRQFNAIADSIEQGLDTFVDQPLALFAQTQQLIQTPSTFVQAIGARVDAYGGLVDTLTSANNPDKAVRPSPVEFRADELYNVASVTGVALSAVSAAQGSTDDAVSSRGFRFRREAIAAAEAVVAQFEQVEAWREQNYAAFSADDPSTVDTGETYTQLQGAVADTVGLLVTLSFELQQERRIRLGRSRAIIDLVGELYGEVDSRLDFFIDTNDLSGNDIVELPAGREVVYYT